MNSTSPAALPALEECLEEPSQVRLQHARLDLSEQNDRMGEEAAVPLHGEICTNVISMSVMPAKTYGKHSPGQKEN